MALPAGVTDRRRRSRTKIKLSTASNRSKSTKVTLDEQAFIPDSNNVLFLLRKSAQHVSFSVFWITDIDLATCVVDASINFPRNPLGAILLDENSTKLINCCRKVVKEATESDDMTRIVSCLRISVHGLRALCGRLTSLAKQDAVVKLLYHAIITSDGACKRTEETEQKASLANFCAGAFEAMGYVLKNYVVPNPCGVGCLNFMPSTKEPSQIFDFFPLPVTRKSLPSESKSGISELELLAIGIKSLISLARVVGSHCRHPPDAQEFSGFAPNLFRLVSLDVKESGLLAVQLLRDFASVWLSSLSTEVSNTGSMAAYLREAHRLVWDLAKSDLISVENCLQLRKEAIAVLLLENGKGQLIIPAHMLRESEFELACECACKASVSYYQHQSTNEQQVHPKMLRRFHEEVGGLLDLRDRFDSVLYLEYCALRALHLGRSEAIHCQANQCSFSGLGYKYHHKTCHSSDAVDPNSAILQLFFVSFELISRVESLTIASEVLHSGTLDTIMKFRKSVLDSAPKQTPSILPTAFKVLSWLSLEKAVNKIIQQQTISPVLIDYLLLIAEVLSECFLPLTLTLAASQSPNNCSTVQMWEITIEYGLRAVAAYEAAALSSSKDEIHFHRADNMLDNLIVILTDQGYDVTQKMWDKSSRFLATVGRRRMVHGHENAAIPALLASIKLFVFQYYKYSDVNVIQLGLVGRWCSLSSLYSILNRVDEAILATVAALAFDTIESCSASCDCMESKLLHFMCGQTNGIVFTGQPIARGSNQRLALVSRLIDLFSRRKHSKSPKVALSKGSFRCSPFGLLDLLMDASKGVCVRSAMIDRYGEDLSFGFALYFTSTTELLPPHKTGLAARYSAEAIVVVLLFLERIGLTFSQKMETDGSRSINREYECTLEYAMFLVQSMGSTTECRRQVLTAMLQLLSATALFPCTSAFGTASLTIENDEAPPLQIRLLAQKYTAEAVQTLKIDHGSSDLGDPWSTFRSILRPLVKLFYLQLASHVNDDNEIVPFSSIMSDLTLQVDPGSDEDPIGITSCLNKVSVLSLLGYQLSLEGEDLHAYHASALNKDAARPLSRDATLWFEAMFSSLPAVKRLLLVSHQNIIGKSVVHEVQSESTVTSLRNELQQSTSSPWKIKESLENLHQDLDTPEDAINDQFLYLRRWVRTSILLGLSECSEKQGKFRQVLWYLRQCFSECQTLLSSATRLKTPLPISGELWTWIAIRSIFVRCVERQADCLMRISAVYTILGDHRKAWVYMECSLNVTKDALSEVHSKTSFGDLLQISISHPCTKSKEMQSRRLLLRLKALATPLDIVSSQLISINENPMLSTVDAPKWRDWFGPNRSLEYIYDLIETSTMMSAERRCSYSPSESLILEFLSLARSKMESLQQTGQICVLIDSFASHSMNADLLRLPSVLLQLAHAKIILRDAINGSFHEQGRHAPSLYSLANDRCLSNSQRALAHYILGVMALKKARNDGELQTLWSASSPQLASASLDEARFHLSSALQLLGSSGELLARSAMRCLAVASGAQMRCGFTAFSPCTLINASIGPGNRNYLERILFESHCSDSPSFAPEVKCMISDESLPGINVACSDASGIDQFFSRLAESMPLQSRFVSMAICPTGDLLITSIDIDESNTLSTKSECIFLENISNTDKVDSIYDLFLKPLDAIIHENQLQLQNDDLEVVQDDDDKKRQWWETRERLDTVLQQLVQFVESVLTGSYESEAILVGRAVFPGIGNWENEPVHANLSSKFDAACESEQSARFDDLITLTLTELRGRLSGYDFNSQELRKMGKQELVMLLQDKEKPSNCSFQEHSKDITTFLILDENLQRFPFETMSCFNGRSVCRMPSLPIALAHFVDHLGKDRLPCINPEHVKYIVDPQSNLEGTKERLLPVLEGVSSLFGQRWEGVIGRVPSKPFLHDALCTAEGLLLYFGHGGGEAFMSRTDIEGLFRSNKVTPKTQHARPVRSSVILMGCSSGRLESVNRRGSKTLEEVPIHYDPEGIALSYLLAGAPCVIGNLWDVTDRDIDRYSTALLDSFFRNDASVSLPSCAASARQVCKMKYLVGCAPVCYGLPVFSLHKR